MADSRLLLIAKARDDHDFRMRLGLALAMQATVEAQKTNQSANSKLLGDYVITDPTAVIDKVFNLLATTPALANKIKKVGEAVTAEDITDDEITAGVAAKWEWLAGFMVGRNFL